MGRYVHKVNIAYRVVFRLTDDNGAGVTGQNNASFTKRLYKDGAASGVTPTVTEIGNGEYYAEYTPTSEGYWTLIVTSTSFNPWGWKDDIQVCAFGMSDLLHRVTSSAVNDAAATATSFDTDLTEAVDDYWNGALLVITSGALIGQAAFVKDYNGTTKVVTLEGEGLTAGPADNVTFDLIQVGSQHQIARRAALKPTSEVESEMGSSFRCPAGATSYLTNKKVITGDTLSVKKSDDSTELMSVALTRDTGQTPVSAMDP